MPHENHDEEAEDRNVITASRSCEHFSVTLTVEGALDEDLEMAVLSRLGRALALMMTGDDPASPRLGKIMSSVALENPTQESLRAAIDGMLEEAMEHVRKHSEEKDGD